MSLLFDLIGVLGFSCFVLYRHVELRIELEMDRREHYLDESTQKALIHVVEKHLLADHISVILDKGFNELCDEVRLEDLTRLYQMFGRVNQHEGNDAFAQLTKTFVNYINRKGSSIVLNPDQVNIRFFPPSKLVPQLARLDELSCLWPSLPHKTSRLQCSSVHKTRTKTDSP